jgi:hypothetical protein
MLYLKNTLGGLGRSLTGSALRPFRGSYRWWKLALYAAMFVLPGGSIAVLLFAWVGNRRDGRTARERAGPPLTLPATTATTKGTSVAASGCQTRADAPPCRAAAGKQARQSCDARS